ncbi:HAD family hydrolase [Rhizobium sp. AN80A]|uniref:HAD family hydrolase n=1 Tax=Rhizobium sp. AN80A TaxID=3040673 RepID=UPI0024B31FE6|nr:HAD family hydrolase [Rhizobium sp. AN80A]
MARPGPWIRAISKAPTELLNADGFRVVAVAFKEFDGKKQDYGLADESELTLLGYVAFLDPPKESARQAIAALKSRGVAIKILTGDNDIVTRKVCSEVQIEPGRILLGSEIVVITPRQTWE